MTMNDVVLAAGVPIAIIAATIPWFLDRSALTRLQRLDAITSTASRRGGANSLLREARDRMAIRVGLQILMPRYNAFRALGWFQIAIGIFYGLNYLVNVLAGTADQLRYNLWDSIGITAVSIVSGGVILALRLLAIRRRAAQLSETHGIKIPESTLVPDLFSDEAVARSWERRQKKAAQKRSTTRNVPRKLRP